MVVIATMAVGMLLNGRGLEPTEALALNAGVDDSTSVVFLPAVMNGRVQPTDGLVPANAALFTLGVRLGSDVAMLSSLSSACWSRSWTQAVRRKSPTTHKMKRRSQNSSQTI